METIQEPTASTQPEPIDLAEVLILGTVDGRLDLTGYPRRTVLAAGATALASWAIIPASDRSGGADAALATFRTTFAELRRLGQKTDPGIVGQVLIASTNALVGLANGTPPATRRAALRLASRYAEYTGWMAQEKGNNDAARWWTNHAVELANQGGDRELASYALVRHAELAMYDDDSITVIGLARQVQRNPGSSRVHSFAAQREAQGHAMAHNERDSRRALERAAEWMVRAAREEPAEPALGSVNMTDPVAFATGWCLHDLGQLEHASDILARELDGLPVAAHRARARYGARLALSLAGAGEIDQACAVADPVLTRIGAIDSATIRQDLKQLRRTLTRWHSHGPVRQIMPRLTEALRTNTNGYA
jgi:hypothetical protein